MEVTVQDLLKKIQVLDRQEWELWDEIYCAGCHVGSTSVEERRLRCSVVVEPISEAESVPRVLPKDKPELANRMRLMRNLFTGTLKTIKEEQSAFLMSDAHRLRTESLKRAEKSDGFRPLNDEQIKEKMRRDMLLRALLDNELEAKHSELLFYRWSEHQKKLGNFLRTKAEPPIYYSFAKQLEDPTSREERKKLAFQEWEAARKRTSSEYLKQITEANIANIEKDYGSWVNGKRTRIGNNDSLNLQETMDKKLETHGHEPVHKKARKA